MFSADGLPTILFLRKQLIYFLLEQLFIFEISRPHDWYARCELLDLMEIFASGSTANQHC